MTDWEDEQARIKAEAEANAANDWEVSFVSDLISNFEAYGRRMFISDSQKSHLERIANDE